ncbi:MAG TPA: protein translocase subunit SecF [Chloroflexota bacterium]|jgi:preprotein translocase subunit SecF|nr:protein translocase subunit SecF [Chloroflexota bacterium]
MLNIIGRRYLYFRLSLLIIIPGTIFLIFFGLRPGIDFSGGSNLELQLQKPVDIPAIEQILTKDGFPDSVVQTVNDPGTPNAVNLRTKPMSNTPQNNQVAKVEADIQAQFGKVTQLQFQSIGPVIGAELTRKAIYAVLGAGVLILLYIWYAFRNVATPLRFGICALAALLHDVLVVMGVFAILGKVFKIEIDALFVTAMLTVIGFSVHDTIVVFDRIRENLGRRSGDPFETVVNASIVQTLARSLNTSITVLLTLLALYLFGGVSIRLFVLALLVGIFSGTYSSIFNASCLLVVWQNKEFRQFVPRLLGLRRAAV